MNLKMAILTLGSTLLLACSCAVHPVETPPGPALRIKLTNEAQSAILKTGAAGDWLVVRKYHATDNFIATVRNAPFSHAAVLDPARKMVIESEASGVHATPLMDFLSSCHRVMLVRPKWSTTETRQAALAKAESVVGKPYDLLGLAALDIPDRYYCSELAMIIYRPWLTQQDIIPSPIAPDQLYYFGRVLYDSGAL